MLRAVANSLLSLLLLITLLWGGCISCSQFFMSPRAAVKDCCKAGRCERSQSNPTAPAKECKRMPLTPAASAHVHAELPVTTIAIAIDPLQTVVAYEWVTAGTMFIEHSPPDLQVLNSTFLI